MKRTITTIREDFNKFGYAIEADFVRDQYDQGGVTYELILKERWEDGHFTYPNHHYQKFHNKEDGNRKFKYFMSRGFKVINKDTFTPTEMDNR